jgi:flavorubredoxin
MAKAVTEGVKTIQGVELEFSYYVSSETLSEFDAMIVGIPTYHHDTAIDMKRLFEEAAVKNIDLKSKIGAAFGSYYWSGEAPKLVIEIMKNKFEMQAPESPLLIKYRPDQNSLEKCKEFGKKLPKDLFAQLNMFLTM